MPAKHVRFFVFLPFFVSTATMADCACTNLEVKYNTSANSTAQSSQYCVANTANFAECTEILPNPCGAGLKGYTCPIGGASGNVPGEGDWFGIGLEYIITGDELDTCTSGLALQRSITINGAPRANVKTRLDAPVGDLTFDALNAQIKSGKDILTPKIGKTEGGKSIFASDNYAAVTDTQTIKINATQTEITFSDLPSVYLDAGDVAKTIVQQDKFVASVRNGAGEPAALCGCEFTVTATKNAGSSTLSTVAFAQGSQKDCTFTIVP